MDSSPKQTATVLQFFHYTKACTLIFSVRFQDTPQRLAHFCTLDETQNFSLTRSRGTVAKVSRIYCSLIKSIFSIDRRPLWANCTRRNHME